MCVCILFVGQKTRKPKKSTSQAATHPTHLLHTQNIQTNTEHITSIIPDTTHNKDEREESENEVESEEELESLPEKEETEVVSVNLNDTPLSLLKIASLQTITLVYGCSMCFYYPKF